MKGIGCHSGPLCIVFFLFHKVCSIGINTYGVRNRVVFMMWYDRKRGVAESEDGHAGSGRFKEALGQRGWADAPDLGQEWGPASGPELEEETAGVLARVSALGWGVVMAAGSAAGLALV